MNLARVAQLTTVWGVIFAVVHAYWVAGGAAGMNGDPADVTGAQGYIALSPRSDWPEQLWRPAISSSAVGCTRAGRLRGATLPRVPTAS